MRFVKTSLKKSHNVSTGTSGRRTQLCVTKLAKPQPWNPGLRF